MKLTDKFIVCAFTTSPIYKSIDQSDINSFARNVICIYDFLIIDYFKCIIILKN